MEACNLNTQDEFSIEEIKKAASANSLLTMEIELSMKCNYNCVYCYTSQQVPDSNDMSYQEITDIIAQAKELGARKIIILGGEPTIYPDFFRVVDYINELGLEVEIFTNGSMISLEMAKELYNRKVRTVLKLNSIDPEIMNKLTGRTDGYDNAMNAIDNLIAAGYPDEKHFLGVSTVICKLNENEIVSLWKWLKEKKITPYFEMITPQGKAKSSEWLFVEPAKLEKIFDEISQLDYKLYGNKWDIQPPLVGSKCLRTMYSCLVDNHGNVKPCVGIDVVSGNVREKSLKEIIKYSEIIQDIRNYREKIKGPCRKCEKNWQCYGCRGAAYQLTGDPLASDPLCWRNQDKLDKIYRLPYPVDEIIPQKKKMKMLDTLVNIGDRTSEAEMLVKADNIFADTDGVLSESIYMELMAQVVAATDGFYALENEEEPGPGFIIGARKIRITGKAKVGDNLRIFIHRTVNLGDFGVAEGKVYNKGEVIAEGELKLWGKGH